jgi:O-antigen/teichoic acid export membrane protein
VAFFGLQSDRLVLGWLLDVRFLGIYTIALTLSGATEQIIDQVNNKVLFPSYAELVRDRPSMLYSTLRRARLILLGLSTGCAILLVSFGKPLIDLLYDDRYREAGWILQVLAVGLLGRVLCITYGDVLLARGDSFATMTLTIIYTGIQLAAMPIGFFWGGYRGVIVGLAVTEWLTYGAYAVCFKRLSLWQPELDFPIAAIAGLLAAMIFYA